MSFIRRFSQSQLVRGSLLLFLGNNFASFGNFLYNLFMGRLLGPQAYGDLGAIFSILALLGAPLGILQPLLVKVVSSYWGQKNYGKIRSLLSCLTPWLFISGFFLTAVLLLGNGFLGQFLHLDNTFALMIVAFYFFFTLPSTANRAVLQGTLSFSYLTVNSMVEAILKVIVSVFLVFLNFQLFGALLGPLVGGVVTYLLTIIELRFILRKSSLDKIKIIPKKIFITSFPILLATVVLTAFLNVDIILVRHFFPAIDAGEYVALTTIGKIIFYVVGPIIAVMFPIVSSRASNGISYIFPLLGTLVMALGLASVIIFSYFLFPKLIVNILFGSKYYAIIPYLGLFSFFTTIYTVNSILTYFLLSISYYKPIYLLFPISLLQGILIFIFHRSIAEVIWMNIITSLFYLFTISLFIVKKEGRVFIGIFMKVIPKNIYGK